MVTVKPQGKALAAHSPDRDRTIPAKATEGLAPPQSAPRPAPQPERDQPTETFAQNDSPALPLTEGQCASAVGLLKLFADETRIRIIALLLETGESNVQSLCQRLGQTQPAVSHHLALLKGANVIKMRRSGKHNFYRVAASPRVMVEQAMAPLYAMAEGTPDAAE
ncbi:MAG: winged helix-turn-helix transcriptional regulator [Planctomycetales bacterium]|nr:winged helix-turn-helix transcriptional regulator [Planctomycetales bacterium]